MRGKWRTRQEEEEECGHGEEDKGGAKVSFLVVDPSRSPPDDGDEASQPFQVAQRESIAFTA